MRRKDYHGQHKGIATCKFAFLLLLLIFFVGNVTQVSGQKGLQINQIFNDYGKAKNAVMVSLSGEVMGDYEFTLFKSITIKNDPKAAELTRQCLEKDGKGAKKIKQVVANGVVTSIFLQLPPLNGGNRLILFNEKEKPTSQFVLIYIESENDSEDIMNLILKKK